MALWLSLYISGEEGRKRGRGRVARASGGVGGTVGEEA